MAFLRRAAGPRGRTRLTATAIAPVALYGGSYWGFSPSAVTQLRRLSITAFFNPSRFRSSSLLFLLGAHGLKDSAVNARQLPIVAWARVIWGSRQPLIDLELVLAWARERGTRPNGWMRCSGPTQAYVLTCLRLGRDPLDACRVRLDDGRVLDYRLVPPCVVGVEVRMAVQRWTWKHVATTLGEPRFTNGGGPRRCLGGAAANALVDWPAS